jgi:hypothetical protein
MSDGAVVLTLTEREKSYGDFRDLARVAVNLKREMHRAPRWDALPSDMQESLDMIASKIARILNGDPEHADSWHDIAGYAVLVERRLKGG